jgi:very-short-patch-repair endonuclease
MELDDASRLLPLQSGMFDYVILDEASQCNIAYTLPTMFRANRAVFVGDKEQMRDSTIMFKSNRIFEELAHRYQIPDERQIKAMGTSVQSLLHIADNLKFKTRMLRYHYRSPAELIGFSNEYFYRGSLVPLNSNYLTYKDTNRLIVIHEIKSDWKEEISDNINIAEAKAILELFKELRSDERYQDKSIGILSFFNAQATEIRKVFTEASLKEENDNYKVSIIEGIQGDEKDIIIYSFVIRKPDQKKRYNPLTGEGGDIRGDINRGRVNVGFSRAKMQVHCFISMPISDIPEKIWIKKYLEYAKESGEVAFDSIDLKPFDSYFEEDFYNTIKNGLGKEYKIQNQIQSCGFKIDFVISNKKTGKRIAVECDGPCHFKDEIDEAYGIHVESDEERQRVLESAGWRFCRIKYADWIDEKFDKNTVTKTIADLVK